MLQNKSVIKKMELDFTNERLLVSFVALPKPSQKRKLESVGFLDTDKFNKKRK